MEIKEIIAERISAVKYKDVDKAIVHYHDDVISFDVVNELKYVGIDAVKKRLTEWLSTLSEIKDYDIADIKIIASSEVAYCSSLNHIDAINTDGNTLNMWWRETTCYSKFNDHWKVTHVHSSVPFNPETGKASLGLKPY